MTDKEKILQYLNYKGISKNQFYEKTGLSNGFLDSGSSLGFDKLRGILDIYRDLNINWLLMGREPMIKSEDDLIKEERFAESIFGKTSIQQPSQKNKMTITDANPLHQTGSIAFYEDLDVTAGPDVLFTDGSTSPTDYIHVPNFQDCDVAFPIWGDSMFPAYQSGQVVLCKEFHDWRYYVPFGEVFLIITDNLRTLKYVKKAASIENLLLVSENSHYEAFELPKEHIRRMFFVKGAIKRNMI